MGGVLVWYAVNYAMVGRAAVRRTMYKYPMYADVNIRVDIWQKKGDVFMTRP